MARKQKMEYILIENKSYDGDDWQIALFTRIGNEPFGLNKGWSKDRSRKLTPSEYEEVKTDYLKEMKFYGYKPYKESEVKN